MNKKDRFKVLGCGLPRTGTMSLKHAFQILYDGPCMHGFVWAFNSLPVQPVLDNLNDDEIVKKFFKENGYIGSTDIPFSYHYKRIAELYPDAKLVLTIRNPETWGQSMKESVCRAIGRESFFKRFPMNLYFFESTYIVNYSLYVWHKYINKVKFLQEMTDAVHDGYGSEFFDNWVAEVKATVPEDRLLVFNVAEGWEPLCKFLELPIPDVPFPKINDRASFQTVVFRVKLAGFLFLFGIVSLPIVVAAGLKYYFN